MARTSSHPDLLPRRESPRDAPPFPWRALFVALSLLALLGIALVVRAGLSHRTLPPANQSHLEVRASPNVLVAVQDLSRLETVSFHMERVIELTDAQTHLWGLVDARDQILLVAAADVIAGVDLSQLRAEDVTTDWAHRQVRIRLPAPSLFSVAVDEENTHVHSRTTDPLAQQRSDLESRARQEAARAMRDAALERGILERARASADRSVRSLLTGLGFGQIEITFRPPLPSRE
jgi:hypothetical protein